jgi:hypothetical protein
MYLSGATARRRPRSIHRRRSGAAPSELDAGDGTSHRPGFMHGAVASARRVMAEIAAAGPAEAPG